jgi:glutamyl-tRNA synthetase/glutamyl-Q tRNA(Asp) synthetase
MTTIAARLEGRGVVTRFAPSPTGRLHLGHVVNAVFVWGAARASGGRVLLRVEDHDRQRSRPEFERAILDDLDWLGFEPDDPPTSAFRAGTCAGRQSDRQAVYERALEVLAARGLVYACDCARRSWSSADGGGPGEEMRYPGVCREKGLPMGPGVGLRVRLAAGDERFDDLRHGPQVQVPAEQCGDLLVRDRRGNWTYQFAVTVDDQTQGVTLVVRGDDLLASTARQIQLARLLGRDDPPHFLHHPLVMKTSAQKLSKADGDTSVGDLRAAGWTASKVIGEAAFRVGLVARPVPLAQSDLAGLVAGP